LIAASTMVASIKVPLRSITPRASRRRCRATGQPEFVQASEETAVGLTPAGQVRFGFTGKRLE
jgi:hypothetical protein